MFDVIIIGGSYSGLAAALQLARARRTVLIIDAGERRNRSAAHSHGFLGQDGQTSGAIQARGKAEVLAYPTVTWLDARASHATRMKDGFRVTASGEGFESKRLILATGVADQLPDTPGLKERWGRRAFFCPYCDGYELNRGSLGVLATGPGASHFALLISEWAASGRMTLFLNGNAEPNADELAALRARGIAVERAAVSSFGGQDAVDVQLADGRTQTVDGIFLATKGKLNGPFAEQLGLELDDGPMGPFFKTTATKETNIPGVFACGDDALPMPAVAFAVADGVRAGVGAHQSLVFRP
jgi:thioredoxin reductase